jgi:hypothetical protein
VQRATAIAVQSTVAPSLSSLTVVSAPPPMLLPHRTVSPRLLKPRPVPPPFAAGAPSRDLAASCPLAGLRRSHHHTGRACGDRTPSARRDARMATGRLLPAGSWVGQAGLAGPCWLWARRPPSRPPRPFGP